MSIEGETGEVVAVLAEIAESAETRAEVAETVIDSVIENAGEQIDAAQEQAHAIARAAMETHLGREIAAINERERLWQERHAEQSQQMQVLTETVNHLAGQIAGLATLTVAETSSLTPPTSPAQVEEATETLAEVLPETLVPSDEAENPAPPAPAPKRRHWM